MSHTQGPWKAGRSDMGTIVDGVESKWIYSGDEQYVAVASGRIRGGWSEVMDNARLIAAAPELYDFIATLENDDGKIPDWLWKMRNELLAKVREKDGVQ